MKEDAVKPDKAATVETARPKKRAYYAPIPSPKAPVAIPGGGKSDLPAGWEKPVQLPPGAVRLEDLTPDMLPAVSGKTGRPAPEAPPPPEEEE